jgi:hypothetical protein
MEVVARSEPVCRLLIIRWMLPVDSYVFWASPRTSDATTAKPRMVHIDACTPK